MMEKQLTTHQAVTNTQCDALAVQSGITAVNSGCSMPRCPTALSKHILGGCLFWKNSFWWVSLPHAYAASRLQSTNAKTKPLPHFTAVGFFWLMNPNFSIILHHSSRNPALQPYCSFLLAGARVHFEDMPDIPVLNCMRGLATGVRKKEHFVTQSTSFYNSINSPSCTTYYAITTEKNPQTSTLDKWTNNTFLVMTDIHILFYSFSLMLLNIHFK